MPIRHHPDEAGLIGAIHLAPPWIFAGHDSILAVDIGGTNIRAGVVELNVEEDARPVRGAVVALRAVAASRRQAEAASEAVERLGEMLRELIRRADEGRAASSRPSSASAAPASSARTARSSAAARTCPGNWESSRFNLPRARARRQFPRSAATRPSCVMHNDAVVQGLSEVPFMQDVEHWGVLTIGTGLGNARFTNRRAPDDD